MGITNKIITGLAFIAIIVLGLSASKCSEQKNRIGDLESVILEQSSHISYYKTMSENEAAQKNAAVASRDIINEKYKKDMEAAAKELSIKQKRIETLTKIKTETTGGGVITKLDTVYVDKEKTKYAIRLSDTTKYFDIRGVISDLGFDYTYTVRDSLTFVSHLDKKGNLYITGTSANPNTRITGMQHVQVHQYKNKRFSIGPSIQIGYDTQVRVTPGISFQYSLIRF